MDYRKRDIIIKIVTKNGPDVFVMQVGLDARSRPTAESCNGAIAVEENT